MAPADETPPDRANRIVDAVEVLFAERTVDSVLPVESEPIRSHLGAFELAGVRVGATGALQSCRPMDPVLAGRGHCTRIHIDVGKQRVPGLPLDHETEAYERSGRSRRAALLSEYAE